LKDIFEFKELRGGKLDILLTLLSKDEKKVFDILKLSEDALTATQIYDDYISRIINENPYLKKKAELLNIHIKNKKPLEIRAAFARENNISVPTNRTVTRVLENLKDIGFLVKRKPVNKKAKAYYSLQPKLRILVYGKHPDLHKKKEIEQMLSRVKHIKTIIQEQK
jgi:ribosomal protein S8